MILERKITMKRKIITIDEKKCNGCGLCIDACHEGALQLVDGKAKLVSESYCDGLGDCLPECPVGAIKLEEKETVAYDEEAVKKNMAQKAVEKEEDSCGCSSGGGFVCPSQVAKVLKREAKVEAPAVTTQESQLQQWPCQIKLVPPNAPYLNGAKLLIAATCSAFAYANTHQEFMAGRITLVGCPKLDGVDYSEKLSEIIRHNNIKDITVLRMQVPCCGGLTYAVQNAILKSGKMLPWHVVTLSTEGEIMDQ